MERGRMERGRIWQLTERMEGFELNGSDLVVRFPYLASVRSLYQPRYIDKLSGPQQAHRFL